MKDTAQDVAKDLAKDVEQDVEQDVAQDVFGAAEDGSVKVLILPIAFVRRAYALRESGKTACALPACLRFDRPCRSSGLPCNGCTP